MSEPLIVCCFLWHDPSSPKPYQYTDEHVQRLQKHVYNNLRQDHKFLCFSDHRIFGVDTRPVNRATHVAGTRFMKLMMFAPDGPLVGKRFLYLDLDCVVTGDLDPLVDRGEDLVLWRNPNYGKPGRAMFNTSMILHTGGTRPEFYKDWRADAMGPIYATTGWGGTDQAWVSWRAKDRQQTGEEAHWTDADGVYGAGRLNRVGMETRYERDVYTELPANARIVFFPGNRVPWWPEVRALHPWIERFE